MDRPARDFSRRPVNKPIIADALTEILWNAAFWTHYRQYGNYPVVPAKSGYRQVRFEVADDPVFESSALEPTDRIPPLTDK